MSQKVFIGGLRSPPPREQLGQLFNHIDDVESIQVVTDRKTGRSPGFDFVRDGNVRCGR
jgi:RNA recognition motif-containing protein